MSEHGVSVGPDDEEIRLGAIGPTARAMPIVFAYVDVLVGNRRPRRCVCKKRFLRLHSVLASDYETSMFECVRFHVSFVTKPTVRCFGIANNERHGLRSGEALIENGTPPLAGLNNVELIRGMR